ncbi:MAG: hypothetical protein MI863_16000 [Desulfobacterales bacterium]|nr:hypothetical protein [Desulfobacterales bacterium]
MIQVFSIEFFAAFLFILNIFLVFLLILFVKRVNRRFNRISINQADISDAAERINLDQEADRAAVASAREVTELLEPMIAASNEAALEFDQLIREKKKISRDLNEALDSKIISINLLLSRAGALQKRLEEQQYQIRNSQQDLSPPTISRKEPDILDQQNQIIDLYYQKMDINTIAERLSIPKGEVRLVIDLKEKFVAMEQAQ